MKKRLFAILGTMMLLTIALPPTALGFGYQYSGAHHQDRDVTFCFDNAGFGTFAYESMRNTIRAGVLSWNGRANVSIREVAPPTQGPGCDVRIHPRVDGLAPFHIARGGCGFISEWSLNGDLGGCEVAFNANNLSQFWWYTSNESASDGCLVKYGNAPICKWDAYTVSAHEFGHVLGIGHNRTGLDCYGGYYSWQIEFGCVQDPGYQRAVMYAAAADGYRRYQMSDDNKGIRALYGS